MTEQKTEEESVGEETEELLHMEGEAFQDSSVTNLPPSGSDGMAESDDSEEFIIEEDQGQFDPVMKVGDFIQNVKENSDEEVLIRSESPVKSQMPKMMPRKRFIIFLKYFINILSYVRGLVLSFCLTVVTVVLKVLV